MKCPKCGEPLEKVQIDEVEVDQCPSCSGIWFDFGELSAILSAKDISALMNRATDSVGHDETEASCPACGGEGKMIPIEHGKHGIHVDTCTVCHGHWLDGGELEQLQEKAPIDTLLNMIRLDADLLG